jgi:hypothetical protein
VGAVIAKDCALSEGTGPSAGVGGVGLRAGRGTGRGGTTFSEGGKGSGRAAEVCDGGAWSMAQEPSMPATKPNRARLNSKPRRSAPISPATIRLGART